MDLLINTYGTFIGATGERIVLRLPQKGNPKKRTRKEYAIRRLKKIVILRPSSISMRAVELALEHEVDIVYLGAFGKPIGRIFSSDPKGLATLRRAQLMASSDLEKAFTLARQFVLAKCQNQIRFMQHVAQRYGAENARERLQAEALLESTHHVIASEGGNAVLLGIEGSIAERYWRSFRPLFKFPGRIPQGRDKFNSALNYGYGILYNEVERACLYIGLDPYLGLYHTERYAKPSLVLDLVEAFRVPVVDAAIIPLFVGRQLGRRGDFEKQGKNEYLLSPQGKSKVVEAVLKQLGVKVKYHGRTYELRGAIEEQTQLLARTFLGKEQHFTAFQYATS